MEEKEEGDDDFDKGDGDDDIDGDDDNDGDDDDFFFIVMADRWQLRLGFLRAGFSNFCVQLCMMLVFGVQ